MLIAGWKSFAIRDFSSSFSFFFFTSVIFLEVWRFADQSICLQKNIHDKFRTRRERERERRGRKGSLLDQERKGLPLTFYAKQRLSLSICTYFISFSAYTFQFPLSDAPRNEVAGKRTKIKLSQQSSHLYRVTRSVLPVFFFAEICYFVIKTVLMLNR